LQRIAGQRKRLSPWKQHLCGSHRASDDRAAKKPRAMPGL
jgi:hypothetical protein